MSTSADAMTDDQNPDTATDTAPSAPAPEPNAIRGAFVARTVTVIATPVGLADATAASAAVTLRGAYLARLDGGGAGGGRAPAGSSDNLLRSAYAARLAEAMSAPPTGRPRRAKPKTRAAAKPKRAKPAAKAKKKVAAKAKPKARPKAKAARRPAKRAAARRRPAKAARRRR
jgi:hypothetical protein